MFANQEMDERQGPPDKGRKKSGLALFSRGCADQVRSIFHEGWYPACKPALDWVLALLLLVVTAPAILVCWLLVRLTSCGPGFYSQQRVGLRGRIFSIHKIRTMCDCCESCTGPQWSQAGDPRVTPLGRLLRVTHLDELPQLWNVLCGEMSLVGPRPERPEFVPVLAQAIPRYTERLQIRPGVTGLAQVQWPADTDLDSVRRKLAFDLCYLQRRGLWLDLRILLATAGKVLGVPCSLLRTVLRLPGGEPLPLATPSPGLPPCPLPAPEPVLQNA
jgi:lipopolysaccharide/colanic/teichoic acid biosynthesis glycosyltransferase